MDILGFFGGIITNNVVTAAATAVISIAAWQVINLAWDMFRPFEIPTQFAVKWASEKGFNFGQYYASKLKNRDMLKKTVESLDVSSDQIRDAFISGVKRGAGL